MVLPHELLSTFVQHALFRPNLFEACGMNLHTLELLGEASRRLDASKTIGLNFWLGSVAAKWDRSASFDMLTISMPGLTGPCCNL